MSLIIPSRAALHSRGQVFSYVSFTAMVLCMVLLASGAGEEKRMSIYSPVADYSLNLSDKDGREYVGLLEILEPLGSVSAKSEKDNWKLRFNSIEAQFVNGQNRARVRGKDIDLPARFLMENGRGLVPMDSLVTLLPQFLGIPVVFHVNSRRLFISEAGITYTAELNKNVPAKLVLNFSRPVNPTIATEPGKLRMSFVRDPLLASGPEILPFSDKSITSASFQETNGAAVMTIAGTVPMLATFSNDGRTITVAPAPGGTTPANAPGTPAPAPLAASPPAPGPTPNPTTPARRFLVIVDASHGGAERGAALSDQLSEKDITLAFARRMRQELEVRGIPALVLRDGDTAISLDERAAAVNAQHPALYIAVHAANDGSGVRVYTAMMPPDLTARGPFIAWDGAQNSSLGVSQLSAAVVAAELRKKVPTRNLAAALRPLNNLTNPAIGIEVAPQAGDMADLTSPDYQGAISAAVAAGVEALRPRLEGQR